VDRRALIRAVGLTAKALDLAIPPALLQRAHRVIE
jgi:hypothetical protein